MNTRLFKVQDLLHKEIAFLLIKEVQNPLIKSITISGVKVSKDLKYSEIYFTSFTKDYKKIVSTKNCKYCEFKGKVDLCDRKMI